MYAQYFHDNLAGFSETLCARAPTDAHASIAGTSLAAPIVLHTLIRRYAPAREYRAAASIWSKYLFARLIIPTLVSQLASGRSLALHPGRFTACFDADGLPQCFVFDTPPEGDRAAADFSALIDAALTPVVHGLSAYSRLSPRVFWSNAAMYFSWALDQLDAQGHVDAASRAAARDLLGARRRPDGGHNPFYRPHRSCAPGALDGDGTPIDHCRRLCCMRDLDAGWDLCANCPRAVHHPASHAATG